MTEELCIDSLSKTFFKEDAPPLLVLQNTSLQAKKGDFIALLGPSGCGKSTLLRIIAGLEKASEGCVTLNGKAVNAPGSERGFVFQDPALFPWMNVYENISYGLRARGVYKKDKYKVREYINLVGLAGFEKAHPHELSGGMAQRAALARVLVNEPKVLLLDESLGALDAFTRMLMQDEIIRLWESAGKSQTIVMVTHDVDEAVYMANRIVVMSARPAKIETVLNVEIGRPRRRDDPDFFALRTKILQMLNFAGKGEEPQYYL